MTGSTHSASDSIIYDTPQESRSSRAVVASTTSYTTVSSPSMTYNPTSSTPSTSSMDSDSTTPTHQVLLAHPSPASTTKSC